MPADDSGFDATPLHGLTATQICDTLGLLPQNDGTYAARQGADYFVLLPVGDILPWQQTQQAVKVFFLAGAPAALSWSQDGENAEAIHLGNTLAHHKLQESLAARLWLTAESLGQWSLIMLKSEVANPQFKLAPSDWFPTPMAAPRGEA